MVIKNDKNLSLKQWQNNIKYENRLIINASTQDGCDGWTKLN